MLTNKPTATVNTLIAIPYNPYEPEPYKRWTSKGVCDNKRELKVAEEFWDFIGGPDAYDALLLCFEQAGLEMRPEIDAHFSSFHGTC